jgi:cytosine/adenosine deaminase-related metal-dependent hydrolase
VTAWSLTDYLQHMLGEVGGRYRPEDVYAGTLLGALGALDAGVTTLVDWAHIQNSPAHSDASVAALRDAGIRAVFGHGWSIRDGWMRDPGRTRATCGGSGPSCWPTTTHWSPWPWPRGAPTSSASD